MGDQPLAAGASPMSAPPATGPLWPGTSSAIEATAAFLCGYPPFDGMEPHSIKYIATRAQIVYRAKDSTILSPDDGVPRVLYVIRSGEVRLSNTRLGGGSLQPDTALGPGECFSIDALLEKRATGATYSAIVDTFCLAVPATDFDHLLQTSPRFREFSTRYLTSLLRESRRLLAMDFAGTASEQYGMSRTLRSLIARAPVTCLPETTLRDALRQMSARKIGSMLIVGADGRLAGILTERDVLDRIALPGLPLDGPIDAVMTRNPATLDAEANAYEAALMIAQRGFRHVPVIDSGRVIGVVTERDLFARQRLTTRSLNRAIDASTALDDLRHAARDVRSWIGDMVGQGLAAEHLIEMSTTMNDALTRRAIVLESRNHDLSGIEWEWLAFGSEGRYEQTISTDQDNGLIFAQPPGLDPDAARRQLLPFAQAVNRALDACGFPLCTGNIMAGNPHWCLGANEWHGRFASWIANSDAQQLLNAAIFFDFRALHGIGTLTETLREQLFRLVGARPVFLRQMSEQALASGVPLGLMGGFLTDEAPDGKSSIDLKKSGARLFVDAARVMALATKVEHTNTARRLRLAGARSGMAEDEIAAAVDAFFFIQTQRLRAQMTAADDDPRASHNQVDPRRLNEIDRRLLKESFRQARRLQERLALDYRL